MLFSRFQLFRHIKPLDPAPPLKPTCQASTPQNSRCVSFLVYEPVSVSPTSSSVVQPFPKWYLTIVLLPRLDLNDLLDLAAVLF